MDIVVLAASQDIAEAVYLAILDLVVSQATAEFLVTQEVVLADTQATAAQ